MNSPAAILYGLIPGILFLAGMYALIQTLLEGRKMAALRLGIYCSAIPGILMLPFVFEKFLQPEHFVILSAVVLLPAILLLMPHGKPGSVTAVDPTYRYDERETMFSRREIQAGSEIYREYYRLHPDQEEKDRKWRTEPGLLSENGRFFHPLGFPAADVVFSSVELLQAFTDGTTAVDRIIEQPAKLSAFIKGWLLRMGASDAGITVLKEHHVYSTGGRRERYGKPFEKKHRYAIAFTVEMDRQMMSAAPAAPTVMESARQYFRSGAMAIQLAAFIRSLGYPARAHIDANYELVCPLVAADAGLGTIGRMGLLMTPRHGPRVRIAVVTTDLPLESITAEPDTTVTDFCLRCDKCARACPSQAIPWGVPETGPGGKKWQLDAEACYTYWCKTGTDCGRCVIVCPYSHPDNPLHRFVRRGIRNNSWFRRLAVVFDDLVYGRIPQAGKLPVWMR